MRIGIGLSLAESAAEGVSDALRMARDTVDRPDLAIVFGSIRHDQATLHERLCQEVDPEIVLGGSSFAEIAGGTVTRGGIAVLLIETGRGGVRLSHAPLRDDPVQTGRELGAQLCAGAVNTGLGLLLSPVVTGWENGVLRGLQDRLPEVPIFGGLASGAYDLGPAAPEFWINYVYGPQLARDAVRLALLDLPPEECRVGFGLAHGWQPVAAPVRLTRCEGNKVYEIENIPVFEYFRQFLGDPGSDDFLRLMNQRFGFAIADPGPEIPWNQRSRIKLPIAWNPGEGSVSFVPAENLQDQEVQLIQASRAGVVGGARDAARRCLEDLAGERPDILLVISCCTRSTILHSRLDQELAAIRDVMGPAVPTFGFYSGGEIAPGGLDSGSRFHASTVALLGLKSTSSRILVSVPDLGLLQSTPFAHAEALLDQAERTLDNTESFLASLSRKAYEHAEQLRHQQRVVHRYTPHSVWQRIGQSVARGQYELDDSEFAGAFLFMDVKGFTSFSEAHTPEEVVRTLNQIFQPATEIIYECGGDVDKYIGDCIFASFTEAGAAVEASCRIVRLIGELRAGGNPFDVRIGVNSGRAVRANVGSRDRREYTFIGDAVNLAQRLESNCTPGRILLSQEVYRQAAQRFAAVEEREITVKGKKDPITAFECTVDPVSIQ